MNIVNPTAVMIEMAEADPKRWRWMSERAPENDTLDLMVEPFDGQSASIVRGWCSYRFLRGAPTFWAHVNAPSDSSEVARAEIVFPRRWRPAQ